MTMNLTPTPHNSAKKDEIAKVVIMPGDPLRAKWIAETFLENARLVNNIRGAQGYTGSYNGKPVTVMSSGMGIPSMSIYAYELYNFYDVELIIRTGTAGSIKDDLKIGDLLLCDWAFTNSAFFTQMELDAGNFGEYVSGKGIEIRGDKSLGEALSGISLERREDFAVRADAEALNAAKDIAGAHGLNVKTGAVLSEDIYYSKETDIVEKWSRKGVVAFEMETAALFANAAQAGKKAVAMFTISNSILTGEEMELNKRERGLREMTETALALAANIQQMPGA